MIKAHYHLNNKITLAGLIRRFFLSWLLAVLIEYLLLPSPLRDLTTLDGMAQMSLPRIIGLTCAGTVLLSMIACFTTAHRYERWSLFFVFTALTIIACKVSATGVFLGACLFILLLLIIYGICGWDNSPEPTSDSQKLSKVYLWITVVLACAFLLFVAVWTIGRIYSFYAPCYDFGIFSQMFYYMKETGLPMTTVERDGLLSHFAVHVSPIYYLLLPFYWLFPNPATLQLAQAIILASAVIPLWKIGKHYGLNGVQRMLVCALLLVYPSYSGGTSYDIHENCFLTPLILWLFYGIATKNKCLISITAVLTLTVKEDAAVYVAVIALWLIVKSLLVTPKIHRYNLWVGVALLSVAISWFLAVTAYLSVHGDGVMTYRYENYIYDGSSSLLTVIKSVILNPMKTIFECADKEKLYFISMTMLTLLGLPLLTRRYERYILLIPYLLVNLMSDYPYQHHIFFQYTFGSTAFLLYLTVVNLADLKLSWQRFCALTTAVAISAICFSIYVLPKGLTYPSSAIQNYEYYQKIRDTLDTIPEDASVSATSYYATYLSQRETLYDVHYSSKKNVLSTEYIVLDPTAHYEYEQYNSNGTSNVSNGYENLVTLLEKLGYTQYATKLDTLVIYCS